MQTHPNTLKSTRKSWVADLSFLTLFLGCLFFTLIAHRPLFTPDEGRYAEIAREMVTNHDWVTPTLNGIRYFEKPVLFYWLAGFAIKLGGVHLWTVRSVNAVLGLLGCLFTYSAVRILFDRLTGLLAACILATSMLYYVMSHMVSLDLPVTVFISATLYCFLIAWQQPKSTGMRLWVYASAVFAALAVLTKGLIGLVFPGLIIITWVALVKGWSRLWQFPIITGLLLFLFIAAPWHVLVNARHPEFFYFYFIEQHFLRYTLKDIGHYQPVWFFVPVLLAGLFPWVVFLPHTLWLQARQCLRDKKQFRKELFFGLWAGLVFVFFSFSKSKLIPYLLPIFPALAVLMAVTLVRTLNTPKKRLLSIGLWLLAFLTFALLITIKHILPTAALPHPMMAEHRLTLALIYLLIGTFVSLLLLDMKPRLSIGALILSSAVFLVTAFSAFPDMDTRTIEPLAKELLPILKPQDEVVTYNQYFQDLPFYLQRQVSILNWHNELSYGMAHQDTSAFMINDQVFWKRWNSKQRVFVFINNDELKSLKEQKPSLKMTVLGETVTTSLISNQPMH